MPVHLAAMASLIDRMKRSRWPDRLYRLHLGLLRIRPPVTIGVRTLVLDGADGRESVLLVKHSYRPGWYFPGGGVQRWESFEDAAVREAREEAGVVVEAIEGPYGLYANFTPWKCDHVALYVATRWRREPFSSLEIAEAAFFPARALPEDATAPTRRRVEEYLGERPRGAAW